MTRPPWEGDLSSFLLAEFFGCPRTNCPLDALLPRSSQHKTCELVTHLPIVRRAFRVSTQPITKSSSMPFLRKLLKNGELWARSSQNRPQQSRRILCRIGCQGGAKGPWKRPKILARRDNH